MPDIYLKPGEANPRDIKLVDPTVPGAPPTIVETIIAMDFPMLYYAEPVTAKELRSRVSGATVTKVAQEYPQVLLKSGKAKDLRSKWS